MAKLPTTLAGPENAAKIPQIMAHMIEAHLALAAKDNAAALEHLKQAVAIEDTMDYNEPPDWFMPARETLGGTLLRAGKPAEAEQVFRRDLEVNARSPRSLFGLAESLKAQRKDHDAEWVQRAFDEAWQGAEVKLTVEEL
jgi:tetratricopeptide (TPR) repeat protein